MSKKDDERLKAGSCDRAFSRMRSADLLQRYFNETLSQDEADLLLELWENDPLLLEEARINYEMEHFLYSLGDLEADFDPKTRTPDHLNSSFGFATNADEVRQVREWFPSMKAEPPHETGFLPETENKIKPASLVSKNQSAKTGFPKSALASLAVLGVVFSFLIHREFNPPIKNGRPESAFHALARIDAVVGMTWPSDREPLKAGQELEAGVINFDSGFMELTLTNGVRIVLEGPASFRLNTPKQTFCDYGRISAEVPTSGQGFEVVTPLATVIDLGTEFFLQIEKDKIETHVSTGKVVLDRLSSGATELTGGNAFQVDSFSRGHFFTFDPNLFLTRTTTKNRVAIEQRKELERWRQRGGLIKSRPDLVLFCDFEGKDDSRSGVRLRAGKPATGRWPGKSAISFRHLNDGLETNIRGEMPSATLAASICPERLDRSSQVLMASRDAKAGSLLWQILHNGQIQLTVFRADEKLPFYFESSPVFKRKNMGGWYQIATTIDNEKQEVCFYVDGKEIDRIVMQGTPPLRIDEAVIGNADRVRDVRTNRSFNGKMDEFMVFNRALSPDEIRQLLEESEQDIP